jgi:hypothetical protein
MPTEVMIVIIASMVAVLVMIQMINKATIEHTRAKAAVSGDAAGMKRLLEDNTAEIVRLRARVEVLERLATDGDRKLAGDIERLRSEQRV